MRYVYVQFDEGGPQYAYHRPESIAAEALSEGVFVRVKTRRGMARVRVAGVTDEPPRDNNNRLIETKPIECLA